jgi:3-hydroxyisobutyrate dehydrogenase-like beta-hydroxyacid dehydrogenase
MAKLIDLGAEGRATAAEVARASDVVITMVPDAPDVEKAALGPGGIIEGMRPGAIYVDMSTVDPGTSRKIGAAMREKGVRMVDAPVARTVDNAWAGTLSIMIGGDPADIDEVMPILRTMGDTFTRCGPLGNGHAMKLVNNYISAGIMALHTEALTFGVKSGLKLEDIMALVMSTFAGSRQLGEYLPSKPSRRFCARLLYPPVDEGPAAGARPRQGDGGRHAGRPRRVRGARDRLRQGLRDQGLCERAAGAGSRGRDRGAAREPTAA